jgi:hypothetical protein
MRILLRSKRTQLYYSGENEWLTEPEKAVSFPSSLNAWKLVLKNRTDDEMELVYSFSDPEENLSIPIDPPSVRTRT